MERINKGFTLIELLVVIAIIGILASAVLASMSNARAGARDTARIQAMKQLQTSLELYRSAYGSYPAWQGTDTRAMVEVVLTVSHNGQQLLMY